MSQYLLKGKPVIVVDDEYLFDEIFELGAYLLSFRERILAHFDSLQGLSDGLGFKGALFELKSVENDADGPHIRRKRISKP
jgi:hypothetical protein